MRRNNGKLGVRSTRHEHLMETGHSVTNAKLACGFDVFANSAHIPSDVVSAVDSLLSGIKVFEV
jgi:hypothetical protein